MPADFALTRAKPKAKRKASPNPFAKLPARPLERQQQQAARKVQRAEERLPTPTVPVKRYPTLKHYTPKQRRTIVRGQKKAIRDYVQAAPSSAGKAQRASDVLSATNLGDRETRRQLHKFVGASHTQQRNSDAALARRSIPKGQIVNPPGGLSVAGRRLRTELLHTPTGPLGDPRSLTPEDIGRGVRAQPYRYGTGAANESENQRKIAARRDAEAKRREILGISELPLLKEIPGIKFVDRSTGGLLNQLDRPLHAEVAALRTYQQGGSLKEVLQAGKEGLQNKRFDTFSDVFKDRGFSPTASAILGLGSDVAGNPLNLVSFGAQAPKTALTEGASRLTMRASNLRAAGNTAKAVRLEAQAAKMLERAKTASTNRGIQVGIPGSVRARTSGEATASLSRATGLHTAAKSLREGESVPAQVVQAFGKALNPGFRPPGVPAEEWQTARTILAQYRNELAQATRRGENAGTAVHRALKQAGALKDTTAREAVFNAIERAPKDAEAAASVRQLLGVGVQASKKAQKRTPEYQARKAAIDDELSTVRTARDAARAERAAAESAYETALQRAGVAQGRAEILSRNVSGSMSEGKVLAQMRAGQPLAGGGRAAHGAVDDLWAAANRVDDARVAEKTAEGAYAAAKRAAKKQRKALNKVKGDLAHQHAEREISKLPAHSIEDLPQELQPVATYIRDTLDAAGQHGLSEGVLDRLRRNYMPHQLPPERGIGRRMNGASLSRRNEHALERAYQGSAKEINAALVMQGKEPLFDTVNLPRLVADYMAKQGRAVAGKNAQTRMILHEVAKPVDDKTWRDALTDERTALYTMDHEGIHELSKVNGDPNIEKIQNALRKGEPVYAMKRAVAHPWTNAGRARKASQSELGRWFDRVNQAMKTGLTVLNFPAYDLRNATGDTFMAYEAGTGARDVKDGYRASVVLAKMQGAERKIGGQYSPTSTVNVGQGRKIPMHQFVREALEDGVPNTGHVGAEVFGDIRGVLEEGVRHKFGGLQPVNRLRKVGEFRENGIRMATYLGARRRGMTRAEAARHANYFHIDYQDLTDVERGVLRRVFPFYTFAARNVKIQARTLVQNPRKLASYESLREEGAKYSGLDPKTWEAGLEGYQQRGAPVPLKIGGKTRLFFPGLPLTDLGRITALHDPREEFNLTMQMVNPLIKSPIEYFGNHSYFFNGPIYRDESNPTANRWAAAPQLPKVVLGIPVPKAARKGLDKVLGVHQVENPNAPGMMPGYSSKLDYWLRQMPQSNFSTQLLTPATGSHGVTSGEQLFGQLTGIKTSKLKQGDRMEITRISRRLREIAVEVEDIKDLHKDRKGGQYTKEYRRLLDERNRLTKKRERLILKTGGRPNRKPIRQRKPSGIFGTGSGGKIYGSSGSGGKIFGTP